MRFLVSLEKLGPTLLNNQGPNVLALRGTSKVKLVAAIYREKIIHNHFLVDSIEEQLDNIVAVRIVFLGGEKVDYSMLFLGQCSHRGEEIAVIKAALNDVVWSYVLWEKIGFL